MLAPGSTIALGLWRIPLSPWHGLTTSILLSLSCVAFDLFVTHLMMFCNFQYLYYESVQDST